MQLIAVPVNQFGSQAPQSTSCEKKILYKKCGVEDNAFPVLDKVDANGKSAAPFFAWLTSQNPPRGGGTGPLEWNYHKFLIDSEGKLIKRYKPFDLEWKKVGREIERLLA